MEKQKLIESLEARLVARGLALANLKEDMGEQFDRSRAKLMYHALEDTIRVLKGESAKNCTMPQLVHHTNLMLHLAYRCNDGQVAAMFCIVGEELKAFSHNQKPVAA